MRKGCEGNLLTWLVESLWTLRKICSLDKSECEANLYSWSCGLGIGLVDRELRDSVSNRSSGQWNRGPESSWSVSPTSLINNSRAPPWWCSSTPTWLCRKQSAHAQIGPLNRNKRQNKDMKSRFTELSWLVLTLADDKLRFKISHLPRHLLLWALDANNGWS